MTQRCVLAVRPASARRVGVARRGRLREPARMLVWLAFGLVVVLAALQVGAWVLEELAPRRRFRARRR